MELTTRPGPKELLAAVGSNLDDHGDLLELVGDSLADVAMADALEELVIREHDHC